MKLSLLFCLCLLAQGVFPHGEGGRATCNAGQCQGRPGKVGPRGIQGLTGQKGEPNAEIGPVGIQGSKGQKGEQSAKIGPVGPKGIQGLKGQKGKQKRGPIGPRGIQGLKGQRGETGTSEEMEEKVRILEEFVNVLFFALAGSPSTRESLKPVKETMCYIGMKSGQIPDSAITSSSDMSANWAAHLGRLDNQPLGSKNGAWIAGHNRVGEWIQVDLGQPEVVAGVVTQGRPSGRAHYSLWVTSYKISCGNVASSMTTITEHGQDKVFSANTDWDTKVVNKFPQLMTCRYIRIYPQTYNSYMCMRLEIIRGICKDIY